MRRTFNSQIASIVLGFLCSGSLLAANSEQEPVIQYHPDGGYALVTSKGVATKGVPAEFNKQLNTLVRNNTYIQDVAFTPDGGWTILTKNSDITHGIEGSYKDTLRKMRNRGHKVKAVAFDPVKWDKTQTYIVVHDNGYDGHNIPEDLKKHIDDFLVEKDKLKTVEFTPDGGWSIITNLTSWSKMIQGLNLMDNYLDKLHVAYQLGENVDAATFNPDNYSHLFGWVIVSEDVFHGYNIPESLKSDLKRLGLKANTLPYPEEIKKQ